MLHDFIKFFDINYINLYKLLQLLITHFKIKINTKICKILFYKVKDKKLVIKTMTSSLSVGGKFFNEVMTPKHF